MKSVREVALEVINGYWGNGEERRQRLEAAGYSYTEVQTMVNRILSGEDSDDDIKEDQPTTEKGVLEVSVDLNKYGAIKLIFEE